jgi:hypothetical protein
MVALDWRGAAGIDGSTVNSVRRLTVVGENSLPFCLQRKKKGKGGVCEGPGWLQPCREDKEGRRDSCA